MIKLLIPGEKGIFPIAAAEFNSFYHRITGKKIISIRQDDFKSDLIVLGSDAENPLVHQWVIDGITPDLEIRTGTDDYIIRSVRTGKRNCLLLAGGRPRALLYAVYHFFEERCGCSYFWDGDLIPSAVRLDLTGLDIRETPRFQYRGLRYFAHRGLNRFQAEHWNFEQWKQEIDWVIKKRLNLFMLRIGLDDLFQKAFPEQVPYPDPEAEQPESIKRSFDDRNLFWSLQYRGELRRKILKYARERDLLHPEDLGTMTHWYSRTPKVYLEKVKPEFLPQSSNGYAEETGLVWDIRKQKNLDAYWKLTETHIREYGSPELFHTIGLAERRCFPDHVRNHAMKLYTYRRIIRKLRENYPNAPLLIASWDFVMHWSPEEVQALIRELDPANNLILDYTTDSIDGRNNVMNWGILGHFPWIAGFFHAYEPANGFMGHYDSIRIRLKTAADDPYCKGLVFWPENSHGDTLMLEFFSSLSWDPADPDINSFLPQFCRKRYRQAAAEMLKIWLDSLPLIKTIGWSTPNHHPRCRAMFSDLLFNIQTKILESDDPETIYGLSLLRNSLRNCIGPAGRILSGLSDMLGKYDSLPFIRRDCIDLARCVLSRVQNYVLADTAVRLHAKTCSKDETDGIMVRLQQLETVIGQEMQMLQYSTDFSLFRSLVRLRQTAPVNPRFEYTLKGNAENYYCRTYAVELFRGIYLPEYRLFCSRIEKRLRSGRLYKDYPVHVSAAEKKVVEDFYRTPLKLLCGPHLTSAAGLSRLLNEMSVSVSTMPDT